MAGLIKSQILKHLSKFVVNLSPSQISLSALKGEGELTGLELNCAVLTQLLELPVWVRSDLPSSPPHPSLVLTNFYPPGWCRPAVTERPSGSNGPS